MRQYNDKNVDFLRKFQSHLLKDQSSKEQVLFLNNKQNRTLFLGKFLYHNYILKTHVRI